MDNKKGERKMATAQSTMEARLAKLKQRAERRKADAQYRHELTPKEAEIQRENVDILYEAQVDTLEEN